MLGAATGNFYFCPLGDFHKSRLSGVLEFAAPTWTSANPVPRTEHNADFSWRGPHAMGDGYIAGCHNNDWQRSSSFKNEIGNDDEKCNQTCESAPFFEPRNGGWAAS